MVIMKNELNNTLELIAILFLIVIPIVVLFPLSLLTTQIAIKKYHIKDVPFAKRAFLTFLQIITFVGAIFIFSFIPLSLRPQSDMLFIVIGHSFAFTATWIIGMLLYKFFTTIPQKDSKKLSFIVATTNSILVIGGSILLQILFYINQIL